MDVIAQQFKKVQGRFLKKSSREMTKFCDPMIRGFWAACRALTLWPQRLHHGRRPIRLDRMSIGPTNRPNLTCISADEALQRLIDGNERFCRGETHLPRGQNQVLAELVHGQTPYATILGCSDSRVPPELIFDAGLGDLFVVRVAGNVLSSEIAGSLQYAGSHLCTPLFVVLGHDGCGAVQAALATKFAGVQQRSRIQSLVDNILPGLADVDMELPPETRLEKAVESNVRWTVRQILESPEGQARLAEGRMRLVGAIYEIVSGRVRFLPT